MSSKKQPNLLFSFVPIIVLVGFLILNVDVVYGDDALSGANQLALLLGAATAAIIGTIIGFKWDEILLGIVSSIKSALPALIILLLIGSLAGTWLLSGIVPAMIYYGLDILNPTIFLFATCLICSIVSLATGSSWTTSATVGIALIGIGTVLGFDKGLVAGAIISGSYFGDKMSPLSDTTNLAPAMAGTNLITHIKFMTITTVPSILITLLIFFIIGFFNHTTGQINQVNELQSAITSKFNVTPWLFLVPVTVIVLIIKKVPAIPALFIGSVLGGVFAIIFQPNLILSLSGETNFLIASYKAVVDAMTIKTTIITDNKLVNELLTSKGMGGMLNTIWLIICAMIFGGAMEVTGMLHRITQSIIGLARTTGSLVATTAFSCIAFNITASDQYLAIVVPGRMFAKEYKDRGLQPELLSRTLEDSGTVTSVLVPWNTGGAYHTSVLGVATGDYVLYCFFNLISPIMTMIFGFLGIKIAKPNKKSIK